MGRNGWSGRRTVRARRKAGPACRPVAAGASPIEERARLDIEDALLYTLERWGLEQRRRYRSQLTQAMRALLDHPERGRPRDELYPGCRSLLIEQHVIYYRLDGDELVVGRVLHGSREPTGKVTP